MCISQPKASIKERMKWIKFGFHIHPVPLEKVFSCHARFHQNSWRKMFLIRLDKDPVKSSHETLNPLNSFSAVSDFFFIYFLFAPLLALCCWMAFVNYLQKLFFYRLCLPRVWIHKGEQMEWKSWKDLLLLLRLSTALHFIILAATFYIIFPPRSERAWNIFQLLDTTWAAVAAGCAGFRAECVVCLNRSSENLSKEIHVN